MVHVPGSLLLAGLKLLLLFRSYDCVHFSFRLLPDLFDLFLLLLGGQRRVRANGLHLRAPVTSDLVALLYRIL